MHPEARRRTYALTTTAAVAAAGGTVTLTVPLPSTPFLDENSHPATFRKVTIQVGAITGGATAITDWALAVTVQFQPMRNGPTAIFAIPAASISNLTVIHDWLAVPAASLHITATNNHGANPDVLTISYGGMVAPNWIDVDHV